MNDTSTVVEVALPIAVAVIMFSLGLGLTTADFKRVLVVPRGVAIGLVNLLVISPFLAFGVAAGFDLAPALAVGLVLLGASPGGAMANLLTHLARGEVALSVTMTAISSVAAVITIPLFLGLAADVFDARDVSDQIDSLGISARVFAITIVPVSLAMWLRPRLLDKVDALKRLALVAFVTVVVVAVVSEWDRMTEHFGEVALAALALNLLAMSISFTVARAARLDPRQATAISMELGVHNSTVAITIATSVATELAIPAAVYSVFMFVTAGAFARLMHARNAVAT